jgi:cytochrome c
MATNLWCARRFWAVAVVMSLGQGAQAATPEISMPEANTAAAAHDATRAEALLNKAVAKYTAHRGAALEDFGRTGPFIDRELYVYALTMKGVGLASGGPSASLVGDNLLERQDAMGDYFFKNLIDKAQVGDSGTVEYRWLNAVDNTVETKIAHFRRIDDTIIVVGHYVPRATPAQARALLDRAVNAVRTDRRAALEAFNQRRGEYFEDDLYVFVIDLNDHQTLAHGADPSLVGADAARIVDVDASSSEHPLIQRMTAAVADNNRGEIEYRWSNPVTGLGERKHAYLEKVDQMIVGVGYYAP